MKKAMNFLIKSRVKKDEQPVEGLRKSENEEPLIFEDYQALTLTSDIKRSLTAFNSLNGTTIKFSTNSIGD